MFEKFKKNIKELIHETATVSIELFYILIPVFILVKILKEIGAIEVLGELLTVVMDPLGLPGEMGLVWAAAMLTNIYGGIATLVSLQLATPLTEAQATVLSVLILLAHALPAEVILCRKVGGVWRTFLFIRLLGALVLGYILNFIFSSFELFQNEALIIWAPQKAENTLMDWGVNQLSNLAFMVLVLFCLLGLMRILKAVGFFDFACSLVKPLFRITGISGDAAAIAVVGLLAGITFGSGLLIAEVKKNTVPQRDIFLTLTFLCLCHGLIEDTSLLILIGGNLWGTLVARLLFAVLVVSFISRVFFRGEGEEVIE